MKLTFKDRLLSSSLLVGAALAAVGVAAPTFAQEGETEVRDRIAVTGSRIPRDENLISTAPITTIDDAEISLRGIVRVEDVVNQLPQAFAAQGANISNGATGTATVNLRGLGAARTLVLVNGRRLPYGSPNSVPADLNQIPSALIESVEVLTGGASAVYGSDALAGVVNFIMQDEFEGVRLDGTYSFYQHNNDNDMAQDLIASRAATNPSQFRLPEDNVIDGFSREITGIIGVATPDGRGNAQVYLGWRNTDPLLQSERDYSSCALSGGATAAAFGCGGSSTSFPGRFSDFSTYDFTLDNTTGEFIPWNSGRDLYNYGPLNYFQRPDTRWTAGFFGKYEINEKAEAYGEFNFFDYESVAQIAPSGSFFSVASINCDNAMLSASQLAAIGCDAAAIAAGSPVDMFIGRRNVEGGGRQDTIENTSYRGVIGLRGAINEFFDYDLSASYSEVHLARTYLNDFSIERLNRAVDVVDDGSGNLVCRSVLDGTDPNCVPWNIFTPGGVTDEALDYLQAPLLQDGNTFQQIVTGSVVGDLGEAMGLIFPGASSGVSVAGGFEYRREGIDATVSTNFASGDGAGQGGPTNPFPAADFDVIEVFGEARIPIAEDQPWADLFSVDLAYRYSSYESGVSTDTYKVGGEYAPVEAIRFRASYGRAVRAANVIELFASQGLGLYDNDDDPCSGATPVATLAQCQNTGVTAAQYGSIAASPAGQYNALFGGNPDLQPETGDTVTLGFVLAPSQFPTFNLSVDYFDIKIEDVIGTVNPITTLNQCLETGAALFCDNIQRDAVGTLWLTPDARIIATNQNLGELSTSGFDIVANYGFGLGAIGLDSFGDIDLNLVATWLEELSTLELPGVTLPNDVVGFYSSLAGNPNPELRSKLRIGWNTPWDVDFSATWRYFDSVNICVGDGNGVCQDTGAGVNRTLDAQNYFDLAGTYAVRDNISLRAGVNNVFDRDPPLSSQVGAGSGNGNTYPQVYDALGRYVFFGATMDF